MITKKQVLNIVDSFRKVNKNCKLSQRNKSSIYQLIIDDYKSSNKQIVSHNRYNKESKPGFVAPAKYGNIESRNTLVLWPCVMINIRSSWIKAVGYNKDERVLKLSTDKYVYAYHNVPESAYRNFLTSNSPGKYFNSFKKIYKGVAIV